jgi:enterobacteria phage integrase
MVTVRLRYVHGFVDRTGRARFYFRHRGKRWPLPGLPGSAEFVARYDELLRQCLVIDQASRIAFGPCTVGFVIEKYLGSTDYTSKARGTQRHYRVALDRLKEICGRALIADLQERHIRQIRPRFTATSKADLAVMLLRMLWVFAKEVLAMDLGPNPAGEIRKLHRQGWKHEPWPESVIEQFAAEARPRPNAQLALMLLLYTGQRASDVVRMRWDQFDGRGIQVRQLKTGTPLWVPCHSRLKEALERAERKSDFILTTRYGKGYSAHGLCGMIAAATAQIGAKECSTHGLRCNAATALAEAGCSVPEIMSITGHRTFKEAQRYADHAQQKKLGQQAIAKWEVANSRTEGKQSSG